MTFSTNITYSTKPHSSTRSKIQTDVETEEKKMKLIIKGKPTYLKRMYTHLRKEHPSTKRRMCLKGGKE